MENNDFRPHRAGEYSGLTQAEVNRQLDQGSFDHPHSEDDYLDPRVAEFMKHPLRNTLLISLLVILVLCAGHFTTEVIFPWIGGW